MIFKFKKEKKRDKEEIKKRNKREIERNRKGKLELNGKKGRKRDEE